MSNRKVTLQLHDGVNSTSSMLVGPFLKKKLLHKSMKTYDMVVVDWGMLKIFIDVLQRLHETKISLVDQSKK